MSIWQALVVVCLEAVLTVLAVMMVERSLVGALRAVKVALESEVSTDTGRVNLVAMILLVFLFVFTKLHEIAAKALSAEKSAAVQESMSTAVILIGLFFALCLVCLVILERTGDKRN